MNHEMFGAKLLEKAQALKYSPGSNLYEFYFRLFGDDRFQRIEGIDEIEISAVLAAQNVSRIPAVYRQYLRHFGRYSGDLFLGLDVNYYYLPTLKDYAVSLCEEMQNFTLPADAFVFWGGQGVSYYYFLTENELEDPPVYVISELMKNQFTIDYDFPYQDLQGVGWKHLSEFLALFILERESEEAYREFLKDSVGEE